VRPELENDQDPMQTFGGFIRCFEGLNGLPGNHYENRYYRLMASFDARPDGRTDRTGALPCAGGFSHILKALWSSPWRPS
jgi:hypothetical protein